MNIHQAYGIAKQGALFLASLVCDHTGKFIYEYNVKTRVWSKKYNILRHCGCVWAMLDVYSETKDQVVLEAAERALGFLCSKHITKWTAAYGRVVHERGYVKQGGNALAILALLKHYEITGKKKHLEFAKDLAYYVRKHISAKDGLTKHKASLKYGEDTGFRSEYYPGEVVLALAELCRHTQDTDYYDDATTLSWWLRVNGKGEVIHDHWLLQGLERLNSIDEDIFFKDYSSLIANNKVYFLKRSAPLACRSEGLLSHMILMQDYSILPVVQELLTFQAAMQVQSDQDRGGFLDRVGGMTIRIDYTQHNISSFIRYFRLLKMKGGRD